MRDDGGGIKERGVDGSGWMQTHRKASYRSGRMV